jgi:probable rRNA maturation factor
MIRFYVEQDPSYPIPVTYLPLMKKVIRACVDEAYPHHRFEVELTLCGDEEIHGVNKEFRGIDRPTDVLSFPMMEFSMPEVYVSLGNIILSVETARRQAEEYGHSLKRELCFLCAHSALHLLGYDHETEDEREEMEAKQREILDALGIKR